MLSLGTSRWIRPLLGLRSLRSLAPDYTETTIACFLLLPFPLLIFFLAGTLRALSAARGVPPDEKRRIVATLVLVLLIYALLFLPRMIFSTLKHFGKYPDFEIGSVIPVYLSPLADLFLYVFMRKSICDRPLASLCCSKMDHDDISTLVENGVPMNSECRQTDGKKKKKDGVV